MAMIDKSSLRQSAVGGSSIAQLRILRRGRCFLETCQAPCGHAYNDRLGACHFLRSKQRSTKAGGIIRMGVSPQYEGSQITILLDGSVDPAALYPPRVVEEDNSTVAAGTILDDFDSSIRASTIRNDDLSNRALRFRRKVIYDLPDVAFLVQTRNDDDNRRR
jgi:hypothetical protein